MTDMVSAKPLEAAPDARIAATAFDFGRALPPALLYRHCDPAELPFELCSELEEAPGLIGQERAIEALNFALRNARQGVQRLCPRRQRHGPAQHG